MAAIRFDQPSTGNVSNSQPALSVTNTLTGTGVIGKSERGEGVHGESNSDIFAGVAGIQLNATTNNNATGVFGKSQRGEGVHGETNSSHFSAVAGIQLNTTTNEAAAGIWGKSERGEGVHGESNSDIFAGVAGIQLNATTNNNATGVFGKSQRGEGVHGETNSDRFAAVAGIQLNQNSFSAGIYGQGRVAGHFQGDVEVTGDIKLINADCAEDFDTNFADNIEPGTVIVLGQEGMVEPSHTAYDKKVAGVISGAGDSEPGIILARQKSENKRIPVALIGKVYCNVDASYSPVEVGDLLTTSGTQGHAMKAGDPNKAFGAVIGKALRPLKAGKGLIPILVALQ